jgi:hypothetical protein
MKQQRHGLFALQVGAVDLSGPKQEPQGCYDPIEQLWRDQGIVLASIGCATPNIPSGQCVPPDKCDVTQFIAEQSEDCNGPQVCCGVKGD